MRWRNWMIGMFVVAATVGGGGFWYEVDWWYYVQDPERGPWPKFKAPVWEQLGISAVAGAFFGGIIVGTASLIRRAGQAYQARLSD